MENSKTSYKEEEIEIDLMELFRALKKRIWLLLLAAVAGGGIFGAFSKFVLVPQYQSTAMLYVLSKETTLTSLADLQIGSQLAKDYQIIVTSRPVLEDVISSLGLDMEYKDLEEKLTIGNPSDSRILTITAEDPDPQMAKAIADEVADTSSDYIGDIMEMIPPKLIEDGGIPTEKSSPSNVKNAVLGAILGLAAVCGMIVLEVVLNDTVENEEDVAKYLGISVLASIPEWIENDLEDPEDDEEPGRGKKSRKKQKRRKKQ